MKKFNVRTVVMSLLLIATLLSCDNDIDNLGSDIVGVDPNEVILSREYDVKTLSSPLNPVQTNNFDSYLLGQYNDPVYGLSTYSIVSQAVPSFLNPDFVGVNSKNDTIQPVLKEVFIDLPFYSTVTNIDGESREYEVDSVYGSGNLDLKIYRNKFLLNEIDPDNLTESATYFSDGKNQLEMVTVDNDPDILFSQDNYELNLNEIEVKRDEGTEDEEIIDRLSPRIRIDLLENDTSGERLAYWSNLIFDSPESLNSVNNFKNSFRGIYITAIGTNPSDPKMVYLNLQDAAIVFSIDVIVDGNDEPVASDYRFSLGGNNIGSTIQANFVETNTDVSTQDNISNSFNESIGSENIYLKGGPGAIGLVDLFGDDLDGDGQADLLTELIEDDVIINDAILEFYVDQTIVEGGEKEPERIIIYNFETGNLLLDYNVQSQGIGVNNNLTHLGRLERVSSDESSDGIRYRIRIVNHLNNIIENALNDNIEDSNKAKNDRLAIAVSQNTSLLGVSQVKNQTTPIEINRILESSAISHEGTVLHGNRSDSADKRPKLTIFYSIPN